MRLEPREQGVNCKMASDVSLPVLRLSALYYPIGWLRAKSGGSVSGTCITRNLRCAPGTSRGIDLKLNKSRNNFVVRALLMLSLYSLHIRIRWAAIQLAISVGPRKLDVGANGRNAITVRG